MRRKAEMPIEVFAGSPPTAVALPSHEAVIPILNFTPIMIGTDLSKPSKWNLLALCHGVEARVTLSLPKGAVVFQSTKSVSGGNG
jgi:hypothetical protein